MENFDYIVRTIPLPSKIRAFTALDSDGLYNVYLNDNLSPEGRRMALRHEFAHIRLNHFYLDLPLAFKERQAARAEKGY